MLLGESKIMQDRVTARTKMSKHFKRKIVAPF
jgi:hypothetical protein